MIMTVDWEIMFDEISGSGSENDKLTLLTPLAGIRSRRIAYLEKKTLTYKRNCYFC
jgi:hypothetical protein